MRQRNGTPPQSVPEADEEDSEGQDSIEEDVEEEDNMDVTEDNAPQSEDDEDNNEYGSEDYDGSCLSFMELAILLTDRRSALHYRRRGHRATAHVSCRHPEKSLPIAQCR